MLLRRKKTLEVDIIADLLLDCTVDVGDDVRSLQVPSSEEKFLLTSSVGEKSTARNTPRYYLKRFTHVV